MKIRKFFRTKNPYRTWFEFGFTTKWDSSTGMGFHIGETVGVSVYIWGLFHTYLSYHAKGYRRDREWCLSFHSGSLWWNLGGDPMGEWNSTDRGWKKWRQNNLNIVRFLIGKHTYETVTVEERRVVVPMPEGNYDATVTIFDSFWRYPRWFTKSCRRADIKLDKMIPHEGKGENSWDCGIDGTWGLTCQAKTIPEAVGTLVGYCLADRVKYGGWSDWKWEKEIPEPRVGLCGGIL